MYSTVKPAALLSNTYLLSLKKDDDIFGTETEWILCFC